MDTAKKTERVIPRSKLALSFTYDVVDEDSAAQGDVVERGWYVQGLGQFPLEPDLSNQDDAPEPELVNAREACERIRSVVNAIDQVNYTRGLRYLSVYPADAEQDMYTGEYTSYQAHVEGDPRLVEALARALGWKG